MPTVVHVFSLTVQQNNIRNVLMILLLI